MRFLERDAPGFLRERYHAFQPGKRRIVKSYRSQWVEKKQLDGLKLYNDNQSYDMRRNTALSRSHCKILSPWSSQASFIKPPRPNSDGDWTIVRRKKSFTGGRRNASRHTILDRRDIAGKQKFLKHHFKNVSFFTDQRSTMRNTTAVRKVPLFGSNLVPLGTNKIFNQSSSSTAAGHPANHSIHSKSILGSAPKHFPAKASLASAQTPLQSQHVRSYADVLKLPSTTVRRSSSSVLTRNKVISTNRGNFLSQPTTIGLPLPNAFKKGRCFRCGERGHSKQRCRNPIKCFRCLKFGHSFRNCKTHSASGEKFHKPQDSNMETEHPLPDHPLPETPPPSPEPQILRAKAFIPNSCKLMESQDSLTRAAFVVSSGRMIKPDDVSQILEEVSGTQGSWTTRRLRTGNNFFVACPSFQVVHNLAALGEIHGEGFSVVVQHWDQIRGGVPHQLKFKVVASLLNLPLTCWNIETVGVILSCFGSPMRASKASSNWEDLTSFDVSFLCEDVENIPRFISITVDHFTFEVEVQVNHVSPYILYNEQSSPPESDHAVMEEEDEEFWFGTVPQRNVNSTGGGHNSVPASNSPERMVPQPESDLNSPSLSNSGQLVNHVSAPLANSHLSTLTSKLDLQEILSQLYLRLLTPCIYVCLTGFVFSTVVNNYNVRNLNVKHTVFQKLVLGSPNQIMSENPYPDISSTLNHDQHSDIHRKDKAINDQQKPVAVRNVFSSLFRDLGISDNSPQALDENSISASSPKIVKRRARLRSKKAKSLGLDVDSLSSQDILFINSLTATDISRFGTLCGVEISDHFADKAALKMKSMEYIRCKNKVVEVGKHGDS